jgi:hypothetical protein
MEEGIRFTTEEQSIALSKCSKEAQLEVRAQLLLTRCMEQLATIEKLNDTIDRMTTDDEG